MNTYNAAIHTIPMPSRIAGLPISPKGYPVPWFVAEVDGVYDFRTIGAGKVERAARWRRCWICGGMMGKYQAVAVGPMGIVNRLSADPGSHRECAVYGSVACPFLNRSVTRCRDISLPPDVQIKPSADQPRANGVTAVWVTDADLTPVYNGDDVAFEFSHPTEVLWFAAGREATREEVISSMEYGMLILMELAAKRSVTALRNLERRFRGTLQFIPAKPASGLEGVAA